MSCAGASNLFSVDNFPLSCSATAPMFCYESVNRFTRLQRSREFHQSGKRLSHCDLLCHMWNTFMWMHCLRVTCGVEHVEATQSLCSVMFHRDCSSVGPNTESLELNVYDKVWLRQSFCGIFIPDSKTRKFDHAFCERSDRMVRYGCLIMQHEDVRSVSNLKLPTSFD